MQLITGAMNLWSGFSRTVKIISFIGIASGAIVSVASAWPIVEPFWYAHRGYVRSYNADRIDPVIKRLVQVQVQLNDDRRQHLLDEAAKRDLELQSDQAKQLPQYKALVQQRVDRIKTELKTIDEQNNSLFNEKLSK